MDQEPELVDRSYSDDVVEAADSPEATAGGVKGMDSIVAEAGSAAEAVGGASSTEA